MRAASCLLRKNKSARKYFMLSTIPSLQLQRELIVRHINENDVYRRKTAATESRRTRTLAYCLPKGRGSLPVCEITFQNTLAVSEKAVRTAIRSIHSKCKYIENKKTKTLNKKLHQLRQQKHTLQGQRDENERVFQFQKPVLNFTDTNFSENEVECLSLGFKYRPTLNNTNFQIKNLERLAVETITLLQSLENANAIEGECEMVIRSELSKIENKNLLDRGSFNSATIKSIKKKISEGHLVLTKADKGSSVVVLHKKDYDEKVLKFVRENNFEIFNPKFPTFIKTVNSVMKECTSTISKGLIYHLSANNTTIPRLYGLLKVHKSDIFSEMPIRPVVSFTNSPTYKLAKC
ncbi:unnamed protein product [Ceutorhynchus assimilis]|uniref:Uncharacterized protein n=1 Tax=Ceutorhynchus assimilis TaxID=467358 RepID=A0A9N9QLE9_9CUCU|nr:unnamed protein product [Ceutorhynchus assimilis]